MTEQVWTSENIQEQQISLYKFTDKEEKLTGILFTQFKLWF